MKSIPFIYCYMDYSELSIEYHSLFTRCFVENCEIDTDEITEEERQALGELEPAEVFENFSDLITDLLKFKKQYINTEQADLVKRANCFETMIQKLESEVRTHIAGQHQLKILVENYQTKALELEKENNELMKKLTDSENALIETMNSKNYQNLKIITKPSKDKFKNLEENKLKSLFRSSSLTKMIEKDDVNIQEKSKNEGIVVRNKEFKSSHKRVKSDFEAIASQIHKKSNQIIKTAKLENNITKAYKLNSYKVYKNIPKILELAEKQKADKKNIQQKLKNLRSCSDLLTQLKGK
ncbi:hypothetical protein SteCoe_449 [Stentor coeruleus]|uniref:Uncharacterized protein n=1 Tax=Stentor coeruleus TaxID=5963 RepID=A0A1R2D4C8_9CILI|nr:hypothetical protein SteCoe_449 [Stentor coeruleus]